MKIVLCTLTVIAALAQPVPPAAPAPPMPPSPPKAPRAAMFGPNMGMNFYFQDRFRDREEDQANRDYERGRRAMEKRQWDVALTHFNDVAQGKQKADAALYWKAISLAKLGKGSEAVAALATLRKTYPQSRWAPDAAKLSAEISQGQSRAASAESATDDELKLVAMSSLAHGDPERAVPLLEKYLERRSAPQMQDRALSLLSRIDNPKAAEIVARVAKGDANPDLQIRAVRHLGSNSKKSNQELLNSIYASSTDVGVRRAVIQGYAHSSNRERLLAIAKGDSNVEMRKEAIQQLGHVGAGSQLYDLYAAESSTDVRSRILRSLATSGNTSRLIELARNEKDATLRQQAIQHLGSTRSPAAAEALAAMYKETTDTEMRKRILRSLAAQRNATQLIAVAKAEKDPEMKRLALQHLSGMRSPEATEYFAELLK
jgi:hypothetical protein